MRALILVSLFVHALSFSTYRVEDWLSAAPSITARSGLLLDSAEYQLILPPGAFHGLAGRQRNVSGLKAFLQQQGVVVKKQAEEIRQVTLFNLSLMDPSQDQDEEETAWELKLRTTIEGKTSDIGLSDLTLKRGDVPENFDWYPDHLSARQAGAVDVENKFELDIQCAERDYTQATKFSFPRGTLPQLVVYEDLQFYFPKVFQTRELAAQLSKQQNFRKMRLPVAEVSFEWSAEISGTVLDVDIVFVIGTRHKDYESAREGEEGWAIRPPELNWRVKSKKVPEDPNKRAAFLAEMQSIFNAFLGSEWNGHQDCGQWNGRKTCAPGFKLGGAGHCVAEGCSRMAAVTKIPRGAPAVSFARPSTPIAPTPFSVPALPPQSALPLAPPSALPEPVLPEPVLPEPALPEPAVTQTVPQVPQTAPRPSPRVFAPTVKPRSPSVSQVSSRISPRPAP